MDPEGIADNSSNRNACAEFGPTHDLIWIAAPQIVRY